MCDPTKQPTITVVGLCQIGLYDFPLETKSHRERGMLFAANALGS